MMMKRVKYGRSKEEFMSENKYTHSLTERKKEKKREKELFLFSLYTHLFSLNGLGISFVDRISRHLLHDDLISLFIFLSFFVLSCHAISHLYYYHSIKNRQRKRSEHFRRRYNR